MALAYQVKEFDREADEVRQAYLLAERLLAKELPEALVKTSQCDDEEYRDGEKLESLSWTGQDLFRILVGPATLWEWIQNPLDRAAWRLRRTRRRNENSKRQETAFKTTCVLLRATYRNSAEDRPARPSISSGATSTSSPCHLSLP